MRVIRTFLQRKRVVQRAVLIGRGGVFGAVFAASARAGAARRGGWAAVGRPGRAGGAWLLRVREFGGSRSGAAATRCWVPCFERRVVGETLAASGCVQRWCGKHRGQGLRWASPGSSPDRIVTSRLRALR